MRNKLLPLAVTASLAFSACQPTKQLEHPSQSATLETTPAVPERTRGYIDIEWDGTVEQEVPRPDQSGFIGLKVIGKISKEAMTGFKLWEQSRYPGEKLEGGALMIHVVNGDVVDCDGRVDRDGGGWSFPGAPEPICQVIGNIVLPNQPHDYIDPSNLNLREI